MTTELFRLRPDADLTGALEAEGIKPAELARRARCSRERVSRLLSGRSPVVRAGLAWRIAWALNVAPRDWFTENNERGP